MEKIKYFEAFLYELLKWYQEEKKSNINDLSILKVLKLLFLWASLSKETLNIYDNFVSWELWPVEKDIYNSIKSWEIESFNITNKNTEIIKSIKCIDKYQEQASKMISYLKKKNPNLILYSASTLVDITHRWNCWKLTRNYKIDKIESSLILAEEWYFYN